MSYGLPEGFQVFYNLQFYSKIPTRGLPKRLKPTSITFWNVTDRQSPMMVSPMLNETTGKLNVEETELIAVFSFDSREVTALVGTSYISPEQAKFNLEHELGHRIGTRQLPLSFTAAQMRSQALWNSHLERIHIEGDGFSQADFDTSRTAFYTALYRTLINPHAWYECTQYDAQGLCDTTFSIEPDGTRIYDYILHRSPYLPYQNDSAGNPILHNGYMFTDEGTWDVYRGKYSFYSLVYPDIADTLIQGYINAYREGGWLPKWPGPGYRSSMTGVHGSCIVADAYIRGIRGYNIGDAFDAVIKNFSTDPSTDPTCDDGNQCGKNSFDELKMFGFIPGSGNTTESAGESLNCAYDDTCLANMAQSLIIDAPNESIRLKALNIRPTALAQRDSIIDQLFFQESGFEVVDKDGSLLGTLFGFFRAKSAQGEWNDLPSQSGLSGLYQWRYGYNEGSAWQFMFYMPYDVPALADRFAQANNMSDPKKALENQLDLFFTSTSNSLPGGYGSKIHEAIELGYIGLGQYGSNNQPSWGYVYEYNYTDAPWKTQCIVRNITDPNRAQTHTDYDCFDGVPAGTFEDVYVLFGNGPQGLLGDEDTGSMSALLVTHALGLHPLPGTDRLEFGSPLFNKVTITVPAFGDNSEQVLIIDAPENNRDNIYVESITLNGHALDLSATNYGIRQSQLLEQPTSTLTFQMTDSHH